MESCFKEIELQTEIVIITVGRNTRLIPGTFLVHFEGRRQKLGIPDHRNRYIPDKNRPFSKASGDPHTILSARPGFLRGFPNHRSGSRSPVHPFRSHPDRPLQLFSLCRNFDGRRQMAKAVEVFTFGRIISGFAQLHKGSNHKSNSKAFIIYFNRLIV